MLTIALCGTPSIAALRRSTSSTFFGAAVMAWWRIRKLGLPFLKTADIAVPATVLGLGCGRIGCFLIHDHPGTLAHGAGKWFAVNYPDGPRYDLGLLLGAFDFLMFGALLYRAPLLRRRASRGGARIEYHRRERMTP